ncbi:MAG: B12-binding domain-containing radical SAM protein [Bacteroidales bacterium]
MKILFLRPSAPEETIGLQHLMIVEPLELELLATLVEKEHEVIIIDLILEKQSAEYFIKKYMPDMVCITGYITHTADMLKISQKAKEINSKIIIVVGGVYIEKLPEKINSPFVDYRVVRNALLEFPKLLNYIENRGEFPLGVLRIDEILDETTLPEYNFSVPIPNRSLTKKYRDKYFYVFHPKVALLKTSFGCPFPCSFCFCRKITGDNYWERPLEEVIEELKGIEENEVYIIDDNFLVSKERVMSFIDLLKKHSIKKRFLIYGRADFIAKHPKTIKRFKKYGLRTIIVGFESFNDNELTSLNKKSMAKTNEYAMNVLNKYKVDCYASVIAMPEWSKEDFRKATKKMIDLKIRFLNIQPLTPLEKTDINFDDNNLIINRSDYARWDLAHIVVKPEKMSVKEFYREILKMYIRVLFQPSNLIHHIKYPIKYQIKLLLGAIKVKKQYSRKINE